MKVIVQRVLSSSVTVNGQIISHINRGLNLLIGIAESDTSAEIDWMANKILNLRVFPADEGNSNFQYSVLDISGSILAISQFTLYGDCRKGRRPSFIRSAGPDRAEPLYLEFVTKLRESGLQVETGRFGADMNVDILNDGPITLVIERESSVSEGKT
ncbi:MAG: D-aminoacyl-tRNA deacylase [Cyanobacteria bacterium P01_A01_bin.3]